ncbi:MULTISPECIES: flavin monoamine oxidase family protein [Streptosporangium]|uniref:Monoamine oxidase n=1 Tax=Streptosporangium brasiliense TaxID=47480 RepID=A0ABT9QZ33_9ACTN|nr:NAD(P)/FAD-dependent oxidoreductase [Streptosporangium brasiliense]MDP9862245.1 monoamine oxidase [Streptosporangium brasiliense]
MARTELARLVQKIFQEHRAAARLRVPVDEVRGVAGVRAVSRRALLGGAAALGVGAATGVLGFPVRPARAADQPRVAIVGAGIAGLAAALRLADKGIGATVYEADTRVGGRIYSNPSGAYWRAGQVSEWGAELIDTGHEIIHGLAARFGLPLDDLRAAEPAGSTETYWIDGGYYPYATASADFAPVYQAILADLDGFAWPSWDTPTSPQVAALSNMTTYEWIETRVPGGHSSRIGKLLDVAFTTELGMDTDSSTAMGILVVLAAQPEGRFSLFGQSDTRFHIRGGNDLLPRAIKDALPAGTVRHGWKLEALAVDGAGRQTLVFSVDGLTRTVTADHTILALPQGVLQRVNFSAARFDARKRAAIAALPMGRNTKLALQFDRRLWNDAGPWGRGSGSTMSESGYQTSWESTRAQAGTQGILLAYAGGDHAADFNPASAFSTASSYRTAGYARAVLSQLNTVFPGLDSQWNGKATLAAWHLNPYARGAYAGLPTAYYQYYGGYEVVRQGNVHFAGEHTSAVAAGFMEGGADSGLQAANELLADLGIASAA